MLRESRQVRRVSRPSQVLRRVTGQPASRMRVADLILITGFLSAIWLPLVGMLFGLDAAFVFSENRTLAPRPSLALKRDILRSFPATFESYFNDHFGFRKRLIRWLSVIKVEGLGVSSSPHVVLGKDGWLFLTSDPLLQDYRHTRLFSREELESWRRLLEARRDWLAARGIRYLFVVTPNKETIYPGLMPRAYNRVHQRSRLDQLVQYMCSHSDVRVLDVREDLLRSKDRERLYKITDSHWNQRGAHVAYQRIAGALSDWFPDVEPRPRSAYRGIAYPSKGGDLALMLGLEDRIRDEDLLLEPLVPLLARPLDAGQWSANPLNAVRWSLPPGTPAQVPPFERANTNLPRAVVFHDSFIGDLVHSLSEHFRRVVYSASDSFDRTLVDWERPDVVIQEMVERKLMLPPPVDH
jgi:alginate O-acetyltransferase complex protein AlgJ